MTYGALKARIFSLLDLDAEEERRHGSAVAAVLAALPDVLNVTARKTAFCLKSIIKTQAVSFLQTEMGLTAELPSDGFALIRIGRNGRVDTAERFLLHGRRILLETGTAGDYTLTYYAFPDEVTSDAEDTDVLSYDAQMADAVAFGTAGELSLLIYPSDMMRYTRLMTAYDESVTARAPRQGDTAVKNTVFRRRRGV